MDEGKENRHACHVALQRFSYNLQSLREYVTAVTEHLDQEHERIVSTYRLALTPETMFRVKRILDESPVDSPDRARLERRLRSLQETLEGSAIEIDVFGSPPKRTFKNERVAEAVRHAEREHAQIDQRQRLVKETALVSAVGHAEFLAAALMVFLFEVEPELVRDAAYKLSLTDLQAFDDISEARQYIVERRISEETARAPIEWMKYLREKFHLAAPYLKQYGDQLREIGLRRNLIVHHSGLVNTFYVKGAPKDYRSPNDIGERVGVPAVYLRASIDCMEIVLSLLAGEIWSKKGDADTNETIAHLFSHLSFEALKNERWRVAAEVGAFASKLSSITNESRLICLFNSWQGYKWSGAFDKIRNDVEKFDTSTLDNRFGLARYALLDDRDNFFELFKPSVKSGAIEAWQAQDWPIFREMRDDPRFSETLAAFGIDALHEVRADDEALQELLFEKSKAEEADRDMDAVAIENDENKTA